MLLRVVNVTKKTCLGTKIGIADSPRLRMVGLLGTTSLGPGCGLLIFPTQAVHTFGMKYPLDLVFLDTKKRVVGLRRSVRPYRFSPVFWKAECVLELPASTIELTKTEKGDFVTWEEQPI